MNQESYRCPRFIPYNHSFNPLAIVVYSHKNKFIFAFYPQSIQLNKFDKIHLVLRSHWFYSCYLLMPSLLKHKFCMLIQRHQSLKTSLSTSIFISYFIVFSEACLAFKWYSSNPFCLSSCENSYLTNRLIVVFFNITAKIICNIISPLYRLLCIYIFAIWMTI